MRKFDIAIVLFAGLIIAMIGCLEWLAAAAGSAPPDVGAAHAIDPAAPREFAPREFAPRDGSLALAELPDEDRVATRDATDLAPTGELAARARPAPTAADGMMVVDALGSPQPDLPVGICASERLTGRPCLLPLGTTGPDGFLALPPHRLGTLVVDTAGGRLGTVERTSARGTVRLVLQPMGALVVDVVDAGGRGIEAARVELAGPGGRAVAISDAAGRVRFAALALDLGLTLRTTSAGRHTEQPLPAHRPAGRTLHEIVVLGDAPNGLVTTVLNAAGDPWRERVVRCTFADGRSLRIRSDSHGRITIPLPLPAPGAAPLALDLRLELLDDAGRLSGPKAIATATAHAGTTMLAPVSLTMSEVDSSRRAPPRSGFEFVTGANFLPARH